MKTAVKGGCATGQTGVGQVLGPGTPSRGEGACLCLLFNTSPFSKMCGPTTLGPEATGWSLRKLPEAHAVLRRHGDATHRGSSLGTALLVPY